MDTKNLTGYPSIDKPWLKYYSEEAINAPLPECTMYEYVWQNNKGHLSDVALRYYGSKITYGKLFDNIRTTARAFYSVGVGAGDIVTIMSMHTPETIAAIYALNYLGAAANMVYMTLSEQEIVSTLQNTDSKMLLVLDAALERVAAVKSEINIPIVVLSVADSMPPHIKLGYALKSKPHKHSFLRYTDFLKRGESANPPSMATDHAGLAVIVYTSGTTGEPKGVMLSNDCLNSLVLQCSLSGKNYRRGEIFLNILPPFIGFGIGMMHLGIYAGIESTLWLNLNPEIVVKKFAALKPNRFVIGPAFIDSILNLSRGNLKFLIELTGGGGALSQDKEQELNQFLVQHGSKVKYTQGYGMTEFASVVCMQQNHIYEAGSLGVPLPQANVKIADIETGREQQYNEVGEVCFNAPNTMMGYFKNKEATNQVFEIDLSGTQWLHTGDLGYVDSNGFVFFQGRIKRIYLNRDEYGTIYKLFPQRIEELFQSQPFVRACAVIAKADPDRLHVPIAFVEIKPETGLEKEKAEKEIVTLSQRELPEHHRPVAIRILDVMPMTASGKIDYRALEKQVEEMQPS